MTALPDTNRTRLASVRRVLAVAWRCLDLASKVWVATRRGLLLIAFIVAVTYAIENETGRVLGIAAVVVRVAAGAAVMVWLNGRDGR